MFVPHVMGVEAGSTVVMKSSDAPGHNVHGTLGANGQFNQAIASGQSIEFATKAPERRPYKVICDIHNWMTAYWMVLDNPYWAVTDEKGNFEIKNVPAGTQKVVVWQESVNKSGFLTPSSGEEVTIKADGETSKPFVIPAARIAAGN